MSSDPKKRILETYQQSADKYDKGLSERLGEARFGIESLTRLMLRDMTFSEKLESLIWLVVQESVLFR